jgi:hypothetical protein
MGGARLERATSCFKARAAAAVYSGADMLEVVLRELERIFLEDSGLAEARPSVRVLVSRPAHYLELLENIQVPRLPHDAGPRTRP